jgi:hypothetical protein
MHAGMAGAMDWGSGTGTCQSARRGRPLAHGRKAPDQRGRQAEIHAFFTAFDRRAELVEASGRIDRLELIVPDSLERGPTPLDAGQTPRSSEKLVVYVGGFHPVTMPAPRPTDLARKMKIGLPAVAWNAVADRPYRRAWCRSSEDRPTYPASCPRNGPVGRRHGFLAQTSGGPLPARERPSGVGVKRRRVIRHDPFDISPSKKGRKSGALACTRSGDARQRT